MSNLLTSSSTYSLQSTTWASVMCPLAWRKTLYSCISSTCPRWYLPLGHLPKWQVGRGTFMMVQVCLVSCTDGLDQCPTMPRTAITIPTKRARMSRRCWLVLSSLPLSCDTSRPFPYQSIRITVGTILHLVTTTFRTLRNLYRTPSSTCKLQFLIWTLLGLRNVHISTQECRQER